MIYFIGVSVKELQSCLKANRKDITKASLDPLLKEIGYFEHYAWLIIMDSQA